MRSSRATSAARRERAKAAVQAQACLFLSTNTTTQTPHLLPNKLIDYLHFFTNAAGGVLAIFLPSQTE